MACNRCLSTAVSYLMRSVMVVVMMMMMVVGLRKSRRRE